MPKLKLYNSLTKKVEELEINLKEQLQSYICGPTVYDQAHLGHARTYLTFDLFGRVLKHFNIDLKTQINITDVDDKIIKKSQELQINPFKLTEDITDKFWIYLRKLSCLEIDVVTEVSTSIEDILALIKVLIDGGYAYQSNGSVYFNLSTYLEKGLPLPLRPEVINDDQLKQGQFLGEKRDHRDFALWKAAKESDPKEVIWESPYGPGRPGWHTECVAMIIKNYHHNNGRIDFHFGGRDLIYPHHQNEIIQALAYYETTSQITEEMINDSVNLAQYWSKFFLHIGQLNDHEGKKMSKSLGNFVAIDDWEKDPEIIRMLIVRHHYRSSINWTEGLIQDLEQSHQFLYESLNHLFEWYNLAFRYQKISDKSSNQLREKEFEELDNSWKKFREELDQHLLNDLHLDKVWTSYQDFINLYNTLVLKQNYQNPKVFKLFKEIYSFSLGFWTSMGFIKLFKQSPLTTSQYRYQGQVVLDLTDLLVQFRSQVRESAIKNKNYDLLKLCDHLRDHDMKKLGFSLKDLNKKDSIWSISPELEQKIEDNFSLFD